MNSHILYKTQNTNISDKREIFRNIRDKVTRRDGTHLGPADTPKWIDELNEPEPAWIYSWSRTQLLVLCLESLGTYPTYLLKDRQARLEARDLLLFSPGIDVYSDRILRPCYLSVHSVCKGAAFTLQTPAPKANTRKGSKIILDVYVDKHRDQEVPGSFTGPQLFGLKTPSIK